jgi:rhomboid protease GluP
MAIGIIPNAKEEIISEQHSAEQLFALAYTTLEKTGWKITPVAFNKLIAYTETSFNSWSERVTINIEPGKLSIKSECMTGQLIDWGKNKGNITEFISTFEQLKKELSPEELHVKFENLKSNPDFGIAEGALLEGPKDKVTGFLSIFKPVKGYFVTPILLHINLAVFILMCLSGADVMQPDIETLLAWGANFRPSTLDGQWWRLLTCCFVHIGIIHLLMNMYALLYIGLLLEPLLGSRKFLMAYLLSGITGSLMSLWWHDFTVCAGASGAIFGMYGVFLALLTTNFIDKSARGSLLSSILIFVGYNLMNGMKGDIDNAGHIGGLLGGLFIGYSYYPILKNPDSVQTRNTVMSAVSIIVLLLAVIVYTGANNDVLTYTRNIEKFTAGEKAALEIYSLPAETSSKELSKKIRQGIRIWYENLNIVKSSKTLKLPDLYQRQINLLQSYCYNRINTYQVLLKRVEENTDKYDHVIEEYGKKTETIINELESLTK